MFSLLFHIFPLLKVLDARIGEPSCGARSLNINHFNFYSVLLMDFIEFSKFCKNEKLLHRTIPARKMFREANNNRTSIANEERTQLFNHVKINC